MPKIRSIFIAKSQVSLFLDPIYHSHKLTINEWEYNPIFYVFLVAKHLLCAKYLLGNLHILYLTFIPMW